MTFRDLTGTLQHIRREDIEQRQKGQHGLATILVPLLTYAGINRTRLRYGHRY